MSTVCQILICSRKLILTLCFIIPAFGLKAQKRVSNVISIPTFAFHGVIEKFTSRAHYQNFYDAGIKISYAEFSNNQKALEALNIAAQVGVKIIVSTPELRSNPEQAVRFFQKHPALYGYYIADEPEATKFSDLAKLVKTIASIDSKHMCYINLLPIYAFQGNLSVQNYKNYIDGFVNTVPVKIISYDNYALAGGVLRADWFNNIEIISTSAKRANKPFWSFIQTTAFGPYATPDIGGLRLQVYGSLACGAKGIEYFTYWTLNDDYWKQNHFGNSIVEKDGKKTVLYENIKQVNKEIQQLSGIFMESKVESIYHIGNNIPSNTKELKTLPNHFSIFSTSGQDAIVSTLINNKGTKFLIVVNKNSIKQLQLKYKCDKSVQFVSKTGEIKPISSSTVNMTNIGPGDIYVFTF